MIIAEIIGGLGNQLFEYANAKALSIKLNKDLYLDLSFFDQWKDKDVYRLDKFNTQINLASEFDINRVKRIDKSPAIYRRISRKFGFSPFQNGKFHFDEEWFSNNSVERLISCNDIYISGYFAGEQYFKDIENIIRGEFTLKEPINFKNKIIEEKIVNSNSVSLHIRRGDYVDNKYFAQIPLEYYYNSIELIENKFPNSSYYVFSDNLNWVKNNFKTNVNLHFVDANDSSTDFMELYLMSKCNHNIIANSTFSWWGAWLNKNPDKIVIAPKVWFGDKTAQENYKNGQHVPNNWIKM